MHKSIKKSIIFIVTMYFAMLLAYLLNAHMKSLPANDEYFEMYLSFFAATCSIFPLALLMILIAKEDVINVVWNKWYFVILITLIFIIGFVIIALIGKICFETSFFLMPIPLIIIVVYTNFIFKTIDYLFKVKNDG